MPKDEIIQVGLNKHLYDDIGDASSSLQGSTSSYLSFCYKLQIPKYRTIYPFVTHTTDCKVTKLHSLSKYSYV